MPTTMTAPVVNGKSIQFVMTAAFSNMYGGIEAAMYVRTSLEILQRHPYDMLVFEMTDESHFHVRLAGYHLSTGVLDEKTIVYRTESLKIKTFWLKIDQNEDGNYIGTFLFPEDY